MPYINTIIHIEDKAKKLLFYNRGGFNANEDSAVLETIELTTTPQNVDYGSIENPRAIGVFNSGTLNEQGNVLVGSDQEISHGEFCVVSLKSSDKVETQTVTIGAATSGDADYTYFTLHGNSGSWKVHFYEYALGPGGLLPTYQNPPDGDTTDHAVQINIPTLYGSGEAMAKTIVDQLALTGIGTGAQLADGYTIPGGESQSGAWFSDDFEFSYIGDVITIKDRFLGSRTNASAGTSPFSVGTAQNGSSTARTISLASDSTLGSKALVCVFPS